LPDLLPPAHEFTSREVRLALSEADQALARLDGIARQIAQPESLFDSYLRREALLSSKIEGTHTTIARLALFQIAGRGSEERDDAEEVANYMKAFQYGRSRCGETPMGFGLYSELHELLMAAQDPRRVTPGRFRDCMVVIGKPPLVDARFVPPPAHFVREMMENLDQYLAKKDEPGLIKVAVGHYQFETIHPFRDGNGRIGRLMILLALQRDQILTAPMLYLSAYFEKHQQTYYDCWRRDKMNPPRPG